MLDQNVTIRVATMIKKFNEVKRQAMRNIGFRGLLHLQVSELSRDSCKWLIDSFDPYSVTLYISPDKKIKITPMDVHLTLALPIGERKVKEFMAKSQRMSSTMKSLQHRENSGIYQMGPLSQPNATIHTKPDRCRGKFQAKHCVVHGLLLFQQFTECTLRTLFCQEIC